MIQNPILPGFHPDASALSLDGHYYIATSTFEWWPGVEIYHSTDLVRWELICQPLTRESQACLWGNYNSGSIWAPHLSYSEEQFWLAYTDVKSATAFKDTLNYVITAPEITGPWSEPVFVTASGFDPALFHDDDGRHYFLNMLFDWRLERPGFAGTVIQEFDTRRKKLVGQRRHFYHGNSLGVCEGPQILKRDSWYYLLCAAGGTGYRHAATVARSRSLDGPFEESPYTPLLTAADDETVALQKSGHACFLQVGEEWYITHLCARPLTPRGHCTLGRETALQKIVWENGWPRLANGTHHPDSAVEAPRIAAQSVQTTDFSERIDFAQGRLPPTLKTLRGPLRKGVDYAFVKQGLRLFGGQSLSSLHRQSLLVRRWQSFCFKAETTLLFAPKSFQQMAGLILFYDTEDWFYAFVSYDEETQRRYARVLCANHKQFTYESTAFPLPEGVAVTLSVEINSNMAQFSCVCNGRRQLLGGALPADRLSDDYVETQRGRCVFTGAMVGICCQDMDDHSAYADFLLFDYQEQPDARL